MCECLLFTSFPANSVDRVESLDEGGQKSLGQGMGYSRAWILEGNLGVN